MTFVVRLMKCSVVRTTAALALVLLVSACAQQSASGDTGASPSPSAAPSLPAEGKLVLEIAYTGGFLTPEMRFGRLPLVAVYADGRVITQGPVMAIYPGPALPNVQVQQLSADQVQNLVDQALAAGVADDVDHGTPPIADAPSTRFTVVTEAGSEQTEVYALTEGMSSGPRADEPLPGLTEEQLAARAQLHELLEAVTRAGSTDTRQYVPGSVAAVVTEWTDVDDGLPPQEPAAWPGPPLPGEALDLQLGVHCVTARGEAVQAVLDAARTATVTTPWTTDDGTRWSLTLRPLLPHETGCDDLAAS
jgi:hypothetical protein